MAEKVMLCDGGEGTIVHNVSDNKNYLASQTFHDIQFKKYKQLYTK